MNDAHNQMPPVPRDHDQASASEIMPFRSTKIRITRSPLFIFALITAAATVGGFMFMGGALSGGSAEERMGAFSLFAFIICFYLMSIVLIAVHLYSKTDRPIWAYSLNTLFVGALLTTPLGIPYFTIFRGILPGGASWTGADTFLRSYIGMFFGAGLMEELMKITFVLIGAALTLRADRFRNSLPEWLYNAIRIRGPLDGVLMGLFGGAGFILIETWLQYVPNMVNNVRQNAQGNDIMGMAAGLMLLFPRVAGGMVGHMAWAGITGYFIGLAVLRPKQAPKLFATGWASSAALHAAWNTSRFQFMLMPASALVSGLFVVACLLKARQLEEQAGRTLDTRGSIVVDRPPPAHAPAPPPVPVPPPAPAPMPSAPPMPAPAAPAAQPAAARALSLSLAGATIPLHPGGRIALAGQPALGGRGAGVAGEVTQHPTRADVLGLRNTGAASWNARLRDGTQHVVEPQRNLRLAAGVQIDFGEGLHAVVIEQ